jgi:lipopolysaccharide biosynthesis glycosyltransferase
MDKVALFIAGDERIYFPALVTMLSIKAHNPDVFDYFICFDGCKLTHEMASVFQANEISFIDKSKLKKFGVEEKFKPMSEGNWPIEVFYNYVLPIYLRDAGYKYSVKADYDLLCINKYNLDDILPRRATLGGLSAKVSLTDQGLTVNTLEDLVAQEKITRSATDYMNVGFITFNNDKYVEADCLESFVGLYQYLAEKNPQAKLLEQIAFSLLLYKLQGDYISFTDAYNHRVLWAKPVEADLTYDVKNIHYITQFKPWRPIDLPLLRRVIYRNRGCLFSYRNLWLEFAESVPGFHSHCKERRLTERELVGLQMFIVRTYNERIGKLEKELETQKKKIEALNAEISTAAE